MHIVPEYESAALYPPYHEGSHTCCDCTSCKNPRQPCVCCKCSATTQEEQTKGSKCHHKCLEELLCFATTSTVIGVISLKIEQLLAILQYGGQVGTRPWRPGGGPIFVDPFTEQVDHEVCRGWCVKPGAPIPSFSVTGFPQEPLLLVQEHEITGEYIVALDVVVPPGKDLCQQGRSSTHGCSCTEEDLRPTRSNWNAIRVKQDFLPGEVSSFDFRGIGHCGGRTVPQPSGRPRRLFTW
eukprot:scaffold1720_cov353-Pavlova_lutheri.AAC.17